ncbi:MAG TPA: M48 family metallopeptidase [Gemmatimonadales bacterium]|nr:M48 family metallopeptidase [Gemmatimonadales bacterium]
MDVRRLSTNDLVHSHERSLYTLVLLVSLVVYGVLIISAMANPQTAAGILGYVAMFALAGFFVHALALGRIRGNGVLVSERQFPMVHQMVTRHAQRLGMSEPPTVYVLESGGILNAFATKLLGRRFVILNSDVLALAVRQGESAVSFIVGHELGHHWRGHLKYRWLTAPGRLFPYLGPAYSRACEYTCDRVGAFCEPDGAINGLLLLAAGSWLYSQVDAREFAAQAEGDSGYWVRRAERVSTHPRLPKRVAALLALGVSNPKTQPQVVGNKAA